MPPYRWPIPLLDGPITDMPVPKKAFCKKTNRMQPVRNCSRLLLILKNKRPTSKNLFWVGLLLLIKYITRIVVN